MSDITSRPYKPLMACERCVFLRGEHSLWCEHSMPTAWRLLDRAQVDPGKIEWTYKLSEPVTYEEAAIRCPAQRDRFEEAHVPISIVDGIPNHQIAFVGTRRYLESAEDWAKRCAVITNVKETNGEA